MDNPDAVLWVKWAGGRPFGWSPDRGGVFRSASLYPDGPIFSWKGRETGFRARENRGLSVNRYSRTPFSFQNFSAPGWNGVTMPEVPFWMLMSLKVFFWLTMCFRPSSVKMTLRSL